MEFGPSWSSTLTLCPEPLELRCEKQVIRFSGAYKVCRENEH